ncbi:reeler domain containing 1 [Festucalex cinctus]
MNSSLYAIKMQSFLLYLGATVILSCVALPVAAFSRGAGSAACQTMSPGHIRAQPQDLQQSHVTIRTSVRSYLPGQLVTVTVRSSRDFMGFLLQARSGEDSEVAGGAGSPAEGPVLVGGSWTLAPPGTHTLRCLSEGDTLTHSDKQLKRNLSFVWRAPDVPVGDIRFYITVVQSYFVYWAGIKSTVVRDGSRSIWNGRNTTGAVTERAVFGLLDDNFTPMPALLNKPSQTSSGKQTFTPRNVWSSTESPVPLTVHQQSTNSILQHSRSLLRDNYLDLGPLAEESGGDPYTAHLPFITPLPPDERVETFAPSFLAYSLVSHPHWKDTEPRTLTANLLKPLENPSLLNPNPSVPTSRKPTGPRNDPTSQRSLTTHEIRIQSMSLLPSSSNTGIDRSSTPTLSPSILFLLTPLKSATHKLLLQPRAKLDPSDSRKELHPPASSHQTLRHAAVSQSGHVSNTSKNLSNKAFVRPSTRPQPWFKAHPQTVPPYTQPSLSTRRLNASIFTTKANHAKASLSTMVKSISTFDSYGSSQGVSAQSSPSVNTPRDEHTPKNPSFTHSSSQVKTSPVFSALPKPSPVSSPPKLISIILSSTSTFLSSSSTNSPSSATFYTDGPFSTSSIPRTTSSPSSSATTRSPTITSSSFSTKLSIPSSSRPSSTSVESLSLISAAASSSQATSLHPGPSPAPRRSLNNRPSIPPVLLTSQRQTHIVSSNPKQKFNPSTSSHKLESNIGEELKPKAPKPDTKIPFNPSKTPGMEGKYPEIVPRHSSWELGMLLGCSAGLGMALVVGVRYVYRQACGKRTEVTLHNRVRDDGRGERGMIHVEECGDLVRVRRIRENSLVLLAEYDILASPGD